MDPAGTKEPSSLTQLASIANHADFIHHSIFFQPEKVLDAKREIGLNQEEFSASHRFINSNINLPAPLLYVQQNSK